MKPRYQKLAAIVCAIACVFALHSVRPVMAYSKDPNINPLVKGKITAEYTLLEPLPCIPTAASPCTTATVKTIDVTTYVNYVFRLAIALAAFLAVFMFTVGGFQYMTSEATGGKKDAKDRMTNSVLGLVAALASYLILYTIDPRLVQVNANIEALKVDGSMDSIFMQLNGQILQAQQDFDNWKASTAKVVQKSTELSNQAKTLRDQAEEVRQRLNSTDSGEQLTDDEVKELTLKRENLLASSTALESEAAVRRSAAQIAKGVNDLTKNQSVTENSFLYGQEVGLQPGTTSIAALDAKRAEIAALTGKENQTLDTGVVPDTIVKDIFLPEKNYQLNAIDNYKDQITINNLAAKPGIKFDEIRDTTIKNLETRTDALISSTDDPDLKQRYMDDKIKSMAAIKAVKYDPYIPGKTFIPYTGF